MKRMISMALVLVMCLSFAACVNQETGAKCSACSGKLDTEGKYCSACEATDQTEPVDTTPKEPADLTGKTIIWNGDSICAGRTDTGNWATRIGEKNSMVYQNYAVGGGTVACGLPTMKSGKDRHSVFLTIEKMHRVYPDADYVIFEGGSNDADLLGYAAGGAEDTKLGTFDPENFSGNYDTTTFCGALEGVFYRAKQLWPDKKIGFIIAQKMGDKSKRTYENRRFYFDKAIEICEKWDIPYLDLWNDCELDPSIPTMYDSTKTDDQNILENTGYYIDGQHLTGKGYDVTAEIIEAWLKTL